MTDRDQSEQLIGMDRHAHAGTLGAWVTDRMKDRVLEYIGISTPIEPIAE
jgi:hypothetical protein